MRINFLIYGVFQNLLIVFLMAKSLNIDGQVVINKQKIINISTSSILDTVKVGGYLDGSNTLSRISYDEGSEKIYFGLFRVFEPMKQIVITNNGLTKIFSPRLVLNDSGNFYDSQMWAKEIYKGYSTDKEKLLLLRQYLIDNRVHYHPSGWDDYRYYNMLLGYGYGTCDVVTADLTRLASAAGYSSNIIAMPHHVISNIKTSTQNYLLDSDIEGLYLKLDNSTVADFDDVVNDKYLICRTKHYGKSVLYDKKVDSYISRIFYTSPQPKKKQYRIPSIKGTKPSTDFLIYPGGSIKYDWSDSKTYLQDWYSCDTIPLLFRRFIVANGKYNYCTNFLSSSLSELFQSFSNLETNPAKPSPHLFVTNNNAFFILLFKLPFPILDADVIGNFYQNSLNDSIGVFWSSDNSNWERVKSIKNRTGSFKDSINLQSKLSFIVEGIKVPYYEYYLKYVFYRTDALDSCGIDSLFVENTFQISRFIMPTLRKGINTLSYEDSNGNDTNRHVELRIDWQESFENRPPNPPSNPIFPLKNATVDSLYFGFKWSQSTDPDGDEIIDYEFMLSNRSDMIYPLSSNFNMYVSALEGPIKPYFKVKETGWLNDSETYYWKVRAKDSRGAWGDWSDVWSFTPRGVMRPLNLDYYYNEDTILIKWEQNEKGTVPDFYKVYASNESNGFTPNSSNLIGKTNTTEYIIKYDGKQSPKSSYRITACTNDGQESNPSNYVNLPSLILYRKMDKVVPESLYTLKLAANTRYTPFYYYKEDTTFQKTTIEYKKLPYWLIDKSQGMVTGTPSYKIARQMIYNDSLCDINVKVIDYDNVEKDYSLKLTSTLTNSAPSLIMSNLNSYVGHPYSSFITTNDGDFEYGDINSFEIVNKPNWLNYNIDNDTIYLSGIPDSAAINKNFIVVKAVDSKGESSTKTFNINTYFIPDKCLYFFPNPVVDDGFIILNLMEDSNVNVSIYNIEGFGFGVLVKGDFKKGVQQIVFSSRNLRKGLYILKATIKSKTGYITNSNMKIIKI